MVSNKDNNDIGQLEALLNGRAYSKFKKYVEKRLSDIDESLYSINQDLDIQRHSGYTILVKKRENIMFVISMFSERSPGAHVLLAELREDLSYTEGLLHTVSATNNVIQFSDRDVLISEHNYLSTALQMPKNMLESMAQLELSYGSSSVEEYDPVANSMEFLIP